MTGNTSDGTNRIHQWLASEDAGQAMLWLQGQTGLAIRAQDLAPLHSTASGRQYFRVPGGQVLFVLSPADAGNKNEIFVRASQALLDVGIRAPKVYAHELSKGWLVVEYLGAETLHAHTARMSGQELGHWLKKALALLEPLREVSLDSIIPVAEPAQPVRDADKQFQEADMWRTWFRRDLLGLEAANPVAPAVTAEVRQICADCAEQPRVCTHFDFHSQNLIVVDSDIAMLDFQDLCSAAITLDPVSLLKDCYRLYDPDLVRHLAHWVAERAQAAGQLTATKCASFPQMFEKVGLQRHLRVLGTFARLWLANNNSEHLKDLPLTLNYAIEAADRISYTALGEELRHCQQPLDAFLDGFSKQKV